MLGQFAGWLGSQGRLAMGSKLDMDELVYLINHITVLLIREMFHSLLRFDKLTLEDCVGLFACTKYGVDGVVAG